MNGEFGDFLRRAREKTRLSQAEAAVALGVSEKTVRRWEQGSPVAKGRNRQAIEDVYRVSVEWPSDDEDGRVPRGTIDEDWSPNPALRGLIPDRAYEVALDYCRRLARAGQSPEFIDGAERLMVDSRFAQMNKRSGRELTEGDWVRLVEASWEIIRETLELKGVTV